LPATKSSLLYPIKGKAEKKSPFVCSGLERLDLNEIKVEQVRLLAAASAFFLAWLAITYEMIHKRT